MKKILPLILVLFSFFATLSVFAQQETYSRVKIFTNTEGIDQLAQLGLPVDHVEYKQGSYLIGEFSETELQLINASGFVYEVLQPDISSFYQTRNLKPNATAGQKEAQAPGLCEAVNTNFSIPANFQLGSMGGFFTYQEMLYHLDNMHALFGNLISERQPINGFTTQEGNPMYWVKISDNPDTDEADEPQILLTALHHAREPASLSQMIFMMYYLLENYETDPNIAYLIEHSEIYIVPCLNPDGYMWNEFTNPGGGGMWRKNRRDNTDGTYGVDLNRNYGYVWGYDNTGSSPNPDSGTYRGPGPFSEPETGAIKAFSETHQFQIALNYHAHGNLLIYPWGYVPSFQTPDSTLFRAFAAEMTKENNFNWGTGNQTVGYLTNGVSDDWLYGEQETKNKIYAFTPEIGRRYEDGFWPSVQRIIPICQSTMWQNLSALRFLHNYALLTETSGKYINTLSASADFTLHRIGLEDGGSFTVSLLPQNGLIADVGDPVVISGLELEQSISTQIPFTLADTIAQGDEITYKLLLDNGQGLVLEQTITKYYGQPVLVFNNNCSNMGSWQNLNSATWDITNLDYVSESTSITDSPDGNYLPNTVNQLALTDTIDLTDCSFAELSFWAKWAIEPGYDLAQVQAIDVESGTITPLCGKYSHIGTPNQYDGQPLYDGFQTDWVLETINLSDFIGTSIRLQFELASDGGLEYDGFYFDDLEVYKLPIADNPVTSANNPELNNAQLLLLSCIPNPATAQTEVFYVQPRQPALQTELRVVNATGYEILRQTLPAMPGKGSLLINTQHWSSGLYYYYLQSSHTKTSARKLVVVNK